MLYVYIALKQHRCGTFLLKFKHPVLKIEKAKQINKLPFCVVLSKAQTFKLVSKPRDVGLKK